MELNLALWEKHSADDILNCFFLFCPGNGDAYFLGKLGKNINLLSAEFAHRVKIMIKQNKKYA